MEYRIKVISPRGSKNWVDFSLSGDKKSMESHLKWAKEYYPDDVFKLVEKEAS